MLTILPSSSTRAILLTSLTTYSCIPFNMLQGHPRSYKYFYIPIDSLIFSTDWSICHIKNASNRWETSPNRGQCHHHKIWGDEPAGFWTHPFQDGVRNESPTYGCQDLSLVVSVVLVVSVGLVVPKLLVVSLIPAVGALVKMHLREGLFWEGWQFSLVFFLSGMFFLFIFESLKKFILV